MRKKLSDKEKGQLVLALKEKDTYQVGLAFGLDKQYKGQQSVRNAVYRAYLAAKRRPGKYGLTIEDMVDVGNALASRLPTLVKEAKEVQKQEDEKLEKAPDIKDLAVTGRNKAYAILMKKLDRVGRNNKTLDEVNLSTLATTFGILFDKAQIVQGEATENVAVLAKIDKNISPEDALAMVLKMREVNQESKNTKKK